MYRADRPDPNAIARARRATMAPATLAIPDDAGLVLPAGQELPKAWAQRVTGDWTSSDGPRALYPRTLLWDPAVPLRLELVPAGFNFLAGGWHVAAPLYDYNDLAFQHGTLEERERTAAIVRDLRVPLYETRALFVRQCAETDALLITWGRERADGGDERLAFHRALWEMKPLMLPLPMTWIEGKHA